MKHVSNPYCATVPPRDAHSKLLTIEQRCEGNIEAMMSEVQRQHPTLLTELPKRPKIRSAAFRGTLFDTPAASRVAAKLKTDSVDEDMQTAWTIFELFTTDIPEALLKFRELTHSDTPHSEALRINRHQSHASMEALYSSSQIVVGESIILVTAENPLFWNPSFLLLWEHHDSEIMKQGDIFFSQNIVNTPICDSNILKAHTKKRFTERGLRQLFLENKYVGRKLLLQIVNICVEIGAVKEIPQVLTAKLDLFEDTTEFLSAYTYLFESLIRETHKTPEEVHQTIMRHSNVNQSSILSQLDAEFTEVSERYAGPILQDALQQRLGDAPHLYGIAAAVDE